MLIPPCAGCHARARHVARAGPTRREGIVAPGPQVYNPARRRCRPATHTQIRFYAPVQAEGGSDSDFCLTRPYTHSILLFTTSSRRSSAPLSTGGSPCKASKPKLSHSIELRGGVVSTHRKPPEVRICRLRNQSVVGTRPPSTSTPHWPAC